MFSSVGTRPGLIYALSDPRTGAIRYVGCTVKPLDVRLRAHLSEARRSKSDYYKLRWIRSLLAAGVEPVASVLEHVQESEIPAREVYWIAHFRAAGCRLVNATDGGEGTPNLSPESRAKIGLANSNVSQEERERRRQTMLGRTLSEEARAKIARSKRGHKLGPMSSDHKAKLSLAKMGNQAWLGKKHTETAKLKCSLAKMGNSARLGQPHTDSTKAKLRAIRKERPLPNVKLSWEIVASIRNRYTGAKGEQARIAREVGVSPGIISEIIHNKIWVV